MAYEARSAAAVPGRCPASHGRPRSRSRARLVGMMAATLLGAVAAVTPGVAHGRIGRLVRLRMDGYVGPPPEGRTEQADLTLRWGSTDIRFQVTESMLLSGGGFATRVFDHVRPYRPNFFLRGPKELVDPLSHAATATSWRIIGTWRPGTRDFLVSGVEPHPPAPHAP